MMEEPEDLIPEITSEKRGRKSKKENKFYIDPKLFVQQIKYYYDTDRMTNELAQNIQKIAEGLSYNWRFINYTPSWKEEMVGDAVLKMYLALEDKKYDPDRGYNPFSYFTQIAFNAFTNRIKKEKKQHDGMREYKDIVYMECMSDPSNQGHIYVKPVMESDENDCGYGDE